MNTPANPKYPPIILASGSQYRRQLLEKLGLSIHCHAPNIDESPQTGESASDLALRLSREKALSLAAQYPNTLIIGSDQTAELAGTILGKPGSIKLARHQLQRCSGQEVTFHTGLCLLNTRSKIEHSLTEVVEVGFRELCSQQIDSYINREPALDCAGSFKVEGLGISLFRYVRSSDPNTLIGLPLIKLIDLLLDEGYPIP
jgi:septum formation protein